VIEYVQNFPYTIANFDLRYTRQEIGIDVGYMRSVSHAPNCFAIESSIDELAAAASRNPLDFRLELLAGKQRHSRVTEVCLRALGLGSSTQGPLPGIAFMEGYTSYIAQVAEISIEGAGSRSTRLFVSSTAGRRSIRASSSRSWRAGSYTACRPRSGGDITLRAGAFNSATSNDYRVLRLNEDAGARHPQSSRAMRRRVAFGENRLAAGCAGDLQCHLRGTGKRLRSLPISAHSLA